MKVSNTSLIATLVALTTVSVGCTTTPGRAVDDSVLTGKVKAMLIDDPATKARQIDVDTHNGVVQLNGFVDSAESRSEAAKVARKVEGVKGVDNNLQVRTGDRTVGTVIDDVTLTTKVKAALIADSRTKAYQIEVKSYKGVVTLGGFVATMEEKKAAEEVAASISGVDKVENGIAVNHS